MSEQLQVLNISEQTTISETVLRIVAEYTGFPAAIDAEKIYWQFMTDDECVGVFTLSGAVYLKKFVYGAFTAQFPFCVRYKCRPSDNSGRVGRQNVLDSLGEWMESIRYPDLSDSRTITEIQRTTTTYLAGIDAAGNETYQCNFNLKYRKDDEL